MDEVEAFSRYLKAAEGYLELGMPLDANEELESIAPDLRDDLRVLAVRAGIYEKLEKWELLETVARTLARRQPDILQWWVSWAHATRYTVSVEAARATLLAAMDHHSATAILCYNLACYECQLDRLGIAKDWLKRAFELDPKLRETAIDDPDLEPIWAVDN